MNIYEKKKTKVYIYDQWNCINKYITNSINEIRLRTDGVS